MKENKKLNNRRNFGGGDAFLAYRPTPESVRK